MIQSLSRATTRKPRGLAKPEAVGRVQRGHHGKESTPQRPAGCNWAGLFLYALDSRKSEVGTRHQFSVRLLGEV